MYMDVRDELWRKLAMEKHRLWYEEYYRYSSQKCDLSKGDRIIMEDVDWKLKAIWRIDSWKNLTPEAKRDDKSVFDSYP